MKKAKIENLKKFYDSTLVKSLPFHMYMQMCMYVYTQAGIYTEFQAGETLLG